MRKHLYINDVDICDYGIYISSDTYLNSPLIDYKEYQIPSRDGNVIQYNKRLNNVIRKFVCYIHETTNIDSALNQLKMLLYKNIGYVKLASDYDENKYQFGYLAQDIVVEPFQFDKVATFELYFSCLPQKYYDETEQTRLDVIGADTGQILNLSASTFIQNVMNNVDLAYQPNKNTFVIMPIAIPTGYEQNQIQIKYETTTPSNRLTYMAIGHVDNTRNEPIFDEYLGMSVDGNMPYMTIDNSYAQANYNVYAIYQIENVTFNVTFTRKIESSGESSYTRTYQIKENQFLNDSSFIDNATIVLAMSYTASASQTTNMVFQCVANDVQIFIDAIKMVNDGVAKYIYDNCDWSQYNGAPIFIDIRSRSCYAININTNEKIALDEYCQIFGDINFEDNLTIYVDKEQIQQVININYAYVLIDRWTL